LPPERETEKLIGTTDFTDFTDDIAVSVNIGTKAKPVGLTCWSASPAAQQRRPTTGCPNVVVICYKWDSVVARFQFENQIQRKGATKKERGPQSGTGVSPVCFGNSNRRPLCWNTQARRLCHYLAGLCSAGFQTCCIADFQVGRTPAVVPSAGLETRDTADLEVCATGVAAPPRGVFTIISFPALLHNKLNTRLEAG
jgi:hypothetical protein